MNKVVIFRTFHWQALRGTTMLLQSPFAAFIFRLW